MNILIIKKENFNDPSLIRLTARQVQHLNRTLQAKRGDKLRIGVINGNIGLGEISYLSANNAEIQVLELNDPPPAPLPLTLICALPRPKVFRRLIRSITVLGIKKIYFINCRRVEKSYWQSQNLQNEKITEQIISGLEQAVDTVPPQFFLKKGFKPFVEDELPQIISETTPLLAHPGTDATIPASTSKPLTLAIGPEGGFIPYEVQALCAIGFKPFSFGERILNSETAIPALTGYVFNEVHRGMKGYQVP